MSPVHTAPYQGATNEWLTPLEILTALGPFDLDPCAPRERPWDMARKHYSLPDDGLALPWKGRVWCNPPYGAETWKWVERLADHGNGIALIFARVETKGFFEHVWDRADSVLFIEGRLHFHLPDGERAGGNSGGASVLVAYGYRNVRALWRSGIEGIHIERGRFKRHPNPREGRTPRDEPESIRNHGDRR